MKDGFALHGIDHVSASQANLFAAAPALWVMEKLLGHKSAPGCAAHRGTAAERGIEAGLFEPTRPVEDCISIALDEYDRLAALSGDPNKQKERDAIPGIVRTALAELRQYGVPTRPENERQHKIEVRLEDVPVPVIGYLDFLWDGHGILLDLKTQLRLASEIKEPHARQVALYVKAHGNYQARIAYATPSRIGVYALENAKEHLEALRRIFITMNRFLAVSKDPQELVGIVCPDYGSFYWNDPATRAKGFEIFGF